MMKVVLKETGDVDMVGVWSEDQRTLIAIVHSDCLNGLVPKSVECDRWRWIMNHLPMQVSWTLETYQETGEDE